MTFSAAVYFDSDPVVQVWTSRNGKVEYYTVRDTPPLWSQLQSLLRDCDEIHVAKHAWKVASLQSVLPQLTVHDKISTDRARLTSLLPKHSTHVPLQAGLLLAQALAWTEPLVDLQPGLDPRSLYVNQPSALHVWPVTHQGERWVSTQPGQASNLCQLIPVQTRMGQHLWESYLQHPLTHLADLQARQDAVAALVHEGVVRDAIRSQGLPAMGHLHTLSRHLASYANEQWTGPTRTALETLYELYLLSHQKLPLLLEHAASADWSTSTLVSQLVTHLQEVVHQLAPAAQLGEAVLALDQAPRDFFVQPSYHDALGDVAQEKETLQEQVQDCFQSVQDAWAQKTGQPATAVPLEANDDGTWHFRLANANDTKLLHEWSTAQVHKVLKNGVHFSTKELRELSTQHQDTIATYDQLQRQVVQDAMAVAASYSPVVANASQLVATLDVWAALAHHAAYSPHGYCRPTLTDEEDGTIELEQARHPCVELQESVEFIPNDVHLGGGEQNLLLVTGPNMGGKSTYIRALGSIILLAQVGSFVPCTSAKINLCHHILVRVGAGDMQDRGISTFMAEMLESSAILKIANKRSLIIIDELGRGTSTFDGYGLARAISEHIAQKIGCMCVFATHFHELTALEETEASVKNCHVTAKKGNGGLTFLYEVKPGPCLESFGIQVAEMANVPQIVVEDAKRKAKELENFEYRAAGDAMDISNTAVENFRKLNLPEILNRSDLSDADKREAIQQALCA